MTYWTVSRHLGNTLYTVDGAESKEAALLDIYHDAIRDGNFTLPPLREEMVAILASCRIWRFREEAFGSLRLPSL